MNYENTYHRGEVYYIFKGLGDGSEMQSGRPGIIVSSDIVNRENTTVNVVFLTTQPKKDCITHVEIRSTNKISTALCEQVQTIDTDKIGNYMCNVTDSELASIELGICLALGIDLGSNDDYKGKAEALEKKLEDTEAFYRKMIDRLCDK